jgi:hypothetical protein
MITIRDTLAGDQITIHYLQSYVDIREFKAWMKNRRVLAIDTESTGLNCYRPQWKLRTVQCGNANECYIIPARMHKLIFWTMRQSLQWIGHNGPHDIRCIDHHLGCATGVVCAETFIPSHHADSRNPQEGGVGHGLKELAQAYVDRDADRWERTLKAVFKTIEVPVPGELYKSGPRKGLPKVRKAKLSEGWGLIDPEHLAYLAYAGLDPILTYRIWRKFQPIVKSNIELYRFDCRVQQACDTLQRRAIRLDVPYTERLSRAYTTAEYEAVMQAAEYGCMNIQSGPQVAKTLAGLGIRLTQRTPKGQYKVDGKVLRDLQSHVDTPSGARDFIHCVLLAKQLSKRRESYTDQMLRERDENDRVHPSINTLGARTARMSVSNPPLQQLPTKNREDEQ